MDKIGKPSYMDHFVTRYGNAASLLLLCLPEGRSYPRISKTIGKMLDFNTSDTNPNKLYFDYTNYLLHFEKRFNDVTGLGKPASLYFKKKTRSFQVRIS